MHVKRIITTSIALTTSGAGFELIGTVNHPTTFFKDTNVIPGTTYYYVVTTHTKSFNWESNYSPEVAITINTVPVAVNETYEVDQDTVLEIAAPGVLGNDTDADNDNLTAELVSEPTSGTLELNEDGSFTYTPDEGFTGEDSFIYKAYDGEAYSSEAEVTITVHKKDTEPVEPTTIESFDIGGTEFYAGGSYKLSANATSASKQQLYKFFVRDSNLNWTVLKDYNETNSVTWDATKPGQYLLVVHVKDSESTESYDTFTSRSVTVKDTTIESFTVGSGSDFYHGNSYTVSANADSANDQLYKFYVRDSNLNWTVLKEYSEANSATWDATKPGQYLLVVHVKDSESTKDYDTFTSMSVTLKETPTDINSFEIEGTSFFTGGSYKLSANATSASKQQLYKFFVRDSNLNWTVLKDYNETNSVTWDATKPGQYLLVVHVKDSESTESYDTFTSRSVTVKDTTIESFTVGSGSDFYHGNSYTVSANADSANDQLYKFYVRDSNLNWTVLKEYSEANSATWDATKPGQYLLVVHVKDSESTKDYDTFTSMSVTVKETPTDINSFEIEGTSFFTGGSYKLSANATSASKQQLYKFFVRDSNLNWTVLKDYNETNSVTWDATKPGQYLLVVHVKDSESTESYDTFTSRSVTVKDTTIESFTVGSGSDFYHGNSYTVSANADSANDQLYKFYVRDSNLNWTVLKEYSEANSATWDATKPGQYLLVVHVKDSESTKDYDTFTSMSVTVKETPTDINSFEIEGTSFFTGGSYNLSANATSASEQQLYKFFVRDSNLNWTVLKDYNEINSVTWNPTKPGQYLLVVHVKDSESTKDYDTFTSMSVTVKETPTVQAVLPSALKSYTLSANAIQC
jgi:N-acetylmuramoyl-L-alanine amidase